MPVRDIVRIDEALCDGCGDCVPACAEGAIRIVNGKARLVGDVYCDGLGACLGHCPQGAITVVRRDAEDFDEEAVRRHLTASRPAPAPVPPAGLPIAGVAAPSCPGSRTLSWQEEGPAPAGAALGSGSGLRQWPIQLHLVSPTAPYFTGADVLLAADCVAFAVGDFHHRYLDGRSLAIACPKLDSHQDVYVDKLAAMIGHAGIRRLEVLVMEVPCCTGLVRLVEQAVARCGRAPEVEISVIGIRGSELSRRTL